MDNYTLKYNSYYIFAIDYIYHICPHIFGESDSPLLPTHYPRLAPTGEWLGQATASGQAVAQAVGRQVRGRRLVGGAV